ncbi:sodium:solute symporter family protein [Desulfoscipio gibsoniae]|uniref:Na+/proline symporter n=1 Tax=Desulfoscipio gibsoniae DSM 7213 TaxID=767817 RepID=R4KR03_9FIRM|nr:sodium:solute symporter family protein [Desulfoscipio gibsoniae]AGL02041.1 Na+/proline symporter [Desulfoscipio gibsoniae DSM 7213]
MLIAIFILGVCLVLISAYGYRLSSKSAADYMMAGRSIGAFVLFFYVYFAISSTWSFYGFPGTVYNSGPGFLIFFAFFPHAFLYIFLGPRLWAAGKMYGLFSPVQYLGERYESKTLQVMLALCMFAFLFPYLGIQSIGVGVGLAAATGVPFWVGAVYMSVLMILIVVIGGTRAVAWVNVLLGTVFSVCFIGFIFWVASNAGISSLSEAAAKATEMRPGQLSVPGPLGMWDPKNLIGLAIAGATVFAWPHVIMGTMQAKSVDVMRKMTYGMLGFSLIFCGVAWVWGAIITPLLVPGLEGTAADAVVQLAISSYLPAWASALTVLAVVAAALSTSATQLMVAGIFASRDIVHAGKNSVKDSQLISWTRIGMVVAVAGSLLLAIGRPAELGLMLSNIASPGFAQWLPALLGGIFWARGTKSGAAVGTLAGVVLLIVGNFFYKPLLMGFHPIVVPLVINMILYVTVSLVTTPVSESTRKKFFTDIDEWLLKTRAEERSEEIKATAAHLGN